MSRKRKILFLILAVFCLSTLVGCKTTKYAKVGLDLKYSGGEFKLKPNASIGVTGHK